MEAKLSDAAKYASYGASTGTTIIGSFSLSEIAEIVGITMAIFTFLVSVYFQVKRDRREQQIFKERLNGETKTDGNT